MSQLTTPLTRETEHSAASPGRMPKGIFTFRLSSVWTRASTRRRTESRPEPKHGHRYPLRGRPSALRLVTAAAVAAGFFAVPTASGMSLTDFAELVGMVVVLREVVSYTLRGSPKGRRRWPEVDGEVVPDVAPPDPDAGRAPATPAEQPPPTRPPGPPGQRGRVRPGPARRVR